MALVVKNPSASAGDMSLIPGSGRAPWKRTWQPTPVFLPGESPWAEDSPEGHKELYSTEVTACIHSFISHFLKSVKKNTYFQWFFLLFKLMSNNWNYPRIYIFTMFYFIYLPNYPSILGFSLIFFVSMCVCVCVYVCVCVCDQLLSSVWLFATPWLACQAPLSMEFSRQEHWSELAFPTPGALPNLGIESASLASPALAGGFFTTMPPAKPFNV